MDKDWANSIEPNARIESQDMIVAIHPAVVNGFINLARRYIEREKKLAVQVEKNDEFLDVDSSVIREKLENGEGAKEVDAIIQEKCRGNSHSGNN